MKSKKVLVMDDDDIILDVARDMLEELGNSVDISLDGLEAIEKYRLALEAVKILKQLDPSATVVVSSGYPNDPIMVSHQAHGFSAVLAKPYRFEEMERVISLL